MLPDDSESRINPDVPQETRRLVSQAARALQWINPRGCTCFLDGAQTACSFVLGCIEAGLCECLSGCGNIRWGQRAAGARARPG